ncbi:hypothetical protein C8J56DRAFT_831019 [Mycena floridula]|nr:hypothetical protein C8J56DRAFT_831019 [Mycena floridula]
MAPSDQTLDSIVHTITTATSIATLNHHLRNALPKEAREAILAGTLANGQDPLEVLDFRAHTLGVLYILCARLSSPHPPPFDMIVYFTSVFSPEQARAAPDRVQYLGISIQRWGMHSGQVQSTIQPLLDLALRYPPSGAYLTTFHYPLLLACSTTSHYSSALPVLANNVTEIDLTISPDLNYVDNLAYHYLGGIALTALKRWSEAEDFFEICVTSPGNVPAALQMEALKKLRLVQLISKGQISPLPKYTNQTLLRIFKNTPYNNFINAYPGKPDQLLSILDKEAQLFTAEKNVGLLRQAIARAPRWSLKKLTGTYVTLGLKEIAKSLKTDEEEVRALLLSMIESSDIYAQISSDGTVTFEDPPSKFSKEQVDRVLLDAQNQTAMLGQLEMSLARSKEFLSKAVKVREDWSFNGPGAIEEDMMSMASWQRDEYS